MLVIYLISLKAAPNACNEYIVKSSFFFLEINTWILEEMIDLFLLQLILSLYYLIPAAAGCQIFTLTRFEGMQFLAIVEESREC